MSQQSKSWWSTWFLSPKTLNNRLFYVAALLGLSILASGSARRQSSTLVIWNDSPETLIVELKQKQTGRQYKIQVKPCTSCHRYVQIGPLTCEKRGTVGSYSFNPGSYDAKVSFSDKTVPVSEDQWVLEGNTTHMRCFSITTTMFIAPVPR